MFALLVVRMLLRHFGVSVGTCCFVVALSVWIVSFLC